MSLKIIIIEKNYKKDVYTKRKMTQYRISYKESTNSQPRGKLQTIPVRSKRTPAATPLEDLNNTEVNNDYDNFNNVESDVNNQQNWGDRQEQIDSYWDAARPILQDAILGQENELENCLCNKQIKSLDIISFKRTENRVVEFCSCSPLEVQLIRIGAFPSHSKNMAFSLELLDLHRKYNNRSGVSSSATSDIIQEYQPTGSTYIQFLFRWSFYNFVIIQFQLERLTFAANGLFDGCIACPRPEDSGSLFISADGNFSLFRFRKTDTGVQNRASELKTSYFVKAQVPVNDKNDDDEIDICSNFKAGDISYSRNHRNIRAETGIFGFFCARHEVPLMFCDMTTGERYVYCDALAGQLFTKFGSDREVFLSYDISCKYSVNFKSRLQTNHGLHIPNIRFLIPKMHAKAHGEKCNNLYHINYHPAAGKIDGECCERNWSQLRRIQPIVVRQTEDNRHLQIQDMFWYLNKAIDTVFYIRKLFKKRSETVAELPALEAVFFNNNTSNLTRGDFILKAREMWQNHSVTSKARAPNTDHLSDLGKIDRKLAQMWNSLESIKTRMMFTASLCDGTRRVEALMRKISELNLSISKLYDKRCEIQYLPMQDLNNKRSIFWAQFVEHFEGREVVKSFCDWQGALAEVKLLERDLSMIYWHSKKDWEVLNGALVNETRRFARKLVLDRMKLLEEKQRVIRELEFVIQNGNC